MEKVICRLSTHEVPTQAQPHGMWFENHQKMFYYKFIYYYKWSTIAHEVINGLCSALSATTGWGTVCACVGNFVCGLMMCEPRLIFELTERNPRTIAVSAPPQQHRNGSHLVQLSLILKLLFHLHMFPSHSLDFSSPVYWTNGERGIHRGCLHCISRYVHVRRTFNNEKSNSISS